MKQSEEKTALIGTKFAALVAFCLTGIETVQTFRGVLHYTQHTSYWLIDMRWILPASIAVVINVGFYAYVIWLAVVFYRTAQGRERVLVIGWFGTLFLGWTQVLVSSSSAENIERVEALFMLAGFFAAIDILIRTFAKSDAQESV